MKIAMDGFALSFARGTGVTRYALELSKALAKRHQVFPVYGLNGVGRTAELRWPRFVQSLVLHGEAHAADMRRWGPYAGLYLTSYLLGQPIRPRPVDVDDRIDTSSISKLLPAFTKIYNAPAIYRSAQAYSYVFGRPLRIALKEKVDIWHLTLPIPVKAVGAKCVVTAHDLIHFMLPHSTDVNLRHYRRIVRNTFKFADMIFAISEHTKKDLLSYLDIPEHKIFVTYESVDIPARLIEAERQEVASFLRKSFGLEFGKYFLFYGAIEPKKNVMGIIDAMCAAQTDLPVVIVGRDGWLHADVSARIAQLHQRKKGRRNLVRIDYLPYDQLMLVLKGARSLVFPSLYEGFGIPPLEAMTMGCPVITSRSGAMREVCGDAALYVDPLNAREIAAAIDVLAADDNLAKQLIERGKRQAASFSNDRYLVKLDEGYRLALKA